MFALPGEEGGSSGTCEGEEGGRGLAAMAAGKTHDLQVI